LASIETLGDHRWVGAEDDGQVRPVGTLVELPALHSRPVASFEPETGFCFRKYSSRSFPLVPEREVNGDQH
jgi:hypothetical protein